MSSTRILAAVLFTVLTFAVMLFAAVYGPRGIDDLDTCYGIAGAFAFMLFPCFLGMLDKRNS